MQQKVIQQATVIVQQQLFLESVDDKKTETNTIAWLPDEHQVLDSVTNDHKI